MDKEIITTKENIQAVFQKIHASIETATAPGDYLLSGKLGLSLYYFSLYEVFGDPGHADKSIDLLEQVMNREDENPGTLMGAGFASGITGLGYMVTMLQKAGLAEIDLKEELGELDAAIAELALKEIIQEERLDFLHGAAGIIHYFTSRSDERHIRDYLEKIVTAFCDKAVASDGGLWFNNFIIEEKEKDRIDTGLSHGNSGILLVLLNVLNAGIQQSRIREIVSKGINFIISQRMITMPEGEQYTVFPFSINRDDYNDIYYNQRLAWCYGDLNILLLLYRAAAKLKEPGWRQLAVELTESILIRTTEKSTLVTDSHFCHGSAGLAQVYHALYVITGDSRFNDAYLYWIQKTLSYIMAETDSNYYYGKEYDVLNGLPGVNLVLLSFLSKKELAWSRSLLL